MIGLAAPADSSIPYGSSSVARRGVAFIPTTGIPVIVLHGPFPTRAALGIASDTLLVRPLAPLVPSVRLRRGEIGDISVEDGHWLAFGRPIVCIRRVKGPTVRLMAAPVHGVPDGTETLGRLLRAWWRSV